MENLFDLDLTELYNAIRVVQWYEELSIANRNEAIQTANKERLAAFLASVITLHMLTSDSYPEFERDVLRDMGSRFLVYHS